MLCYSIVANNRDLQHGMLLFVTDEMMMILQKSSRSVFREKEKVYFSLLQ